MRRFLPACLFTLLATAPALAQAVTNQIGTGCPGTNGTPTLTVSQPPRLGQVLSLDLANLPLIQGQVWWLWGVDDSNWGQRILPFDMGAFGMPGCTLYVAPEHLTFQFQTGPVMSTPFLVPQQASLLGCRLLNQVLVCDSGINQIGYTATNAVDLVFGL